MEMDVLTATGSPLTHVPDLQPIRAGLRVLRTIGLERVAQPHRPRFSGAADRV